MKDKIVTALKQTATLDLRSLALLRIGVSTILLIDLFQRLENITAFYTNDGILPLQSFTWFEKIFSLHLLNGTLPYQLCLFSIHILITLFLLIGWKTRTMSLLCWILTLSLINRNTLIINGADLILLYLLLIGIFLPWHKKYSIDSLLHPSNKILFFGPSSITYILHISTLYFFSGLFKLNPDWFSGIALSEALSYLPYQQPLGQLLLSFPLLVSTMNYAVVLFELSIPLLILIPYRNFLFRNLAILGLVTFHLGIGLSLELGLFSFITIISLSGLLPPSFWSILNKFFFQKHDSLHKEAHLNVLQASKSFWQTSILLGIAGYIIFLNSIFLFKIDKVSFIQPLLTPANILRLPNKWDFYAETTPNSHWISIIGTKSDKTKIDLLSNTSSFDLTKPAYDSLLYRNHRWKKYSQYILRGNKEYLGQYICQQQKINFPERNLTAISFHVNGKKLVTNQTYGNIPEVIMYKGTCLQ